MVAPPLGPPRRKGETSQLYQANKPISRKTSNFYMAKRTKRASTQPPQPRPPKTKELLGKTLHSQRLLVERLPAAGAEAAAGGAAAGLLVGPLAGCWWGWVQSTRDSRLWAQTLGQQGPSLEHTDHQTQKIHCKTQNVCGNFGFSPVFLMVTTPNTRNTRENPKNPKIPKWAE